jgi:DNA-binding winged helix-turn-helix (wHTH) protein
MVEGEISFGRFRLDLARRELRRDERLVRLGGRALDILCVLASAGGKVVSKDELMKRVWAGVAVEEHNIQVHISALRRALAEDGDGESWIVTVPGRGYRFLGSPGSPAAGKSAPTSSLTVADEPSLATTVLSLIGEGAALDEAADELVAIATEQGFPFWGALGTICRGWVKAKDGYVIEGISLLRRV